MKEVSVEDFKLYKEKMGNFITKDAETFYFRNLMEAIHDSDYMNEVNSIMEYVSKERTAKEIDELFQMLRAKAEGQFKLRDKTEEYDKKVNYSLRGLAYFCLVEALNENSSFSEKIIEDIKKKYGKDYLDIVKKIDRAYLSVDGKTILKEQNLQLPNDEEMKKYLVMKKWQDEQRLYSMKRIRPLYPLELEYIDEPDQNLMLIHKKTLVKRAKEDLKKMKIVPIEYLAKLYEAGLEDELKDMIGGKALGLTKLRASEIRIPKTYVIPYYIEIEDNEIKNLLDENKKYAVRSSANVEDGGIHSFAGMFDSYLNVEKKNITDRVRDVKKSVKNDRVKKYIEINNLQQPNMNVVIQEFIEPEISGVWIGQSEDKGVLEWIEGNGEKLVSGKETPTREVWNRNTGTQDGIKTNDYIGKQLLDIQNTLAKSNGDTADMEWCVINGELILLQYRPVTREISMEENKTLTNSDEEIFVGSPASTGEVIGKSAYYRNLKDIEKWNDGDILISMFTDPDWLDIMSRSSGLVTAVGGMLCHSAIIARELGIPCVTGIGRKALKALRDENEIYVNGTTGEVCSSRIYEKTKKKENDKYRYYTSFENIINNEKKDLPIRLINFLTHSNGLCSGNSREEALVQGICEIFERYCYKKIIFEEIKVKNIVIKNLEQYPISEQLREVKNMGFEYKIKDCSLGGKFPVVGFMLLKGNTKYLFTVGSDPNFNIALQRCITEAFQGLKKENIEAKMKNINNCYEKYKEEYGEEFLQNNWLKCYSSNAGIHPNSMFLDNEIDIKELPFKNVKGNKEALKTILEIAKKNKMNIYIKDYSMMGFNTFKVYIPNFSEIETIKPSNIKISANMKKIKNIYFNLFEKQENIEFEKIFYECSKNIKYTELIKPSNLMGINCLVKGEYFALDYFYVFIIYLINLKRYEETIEYIDERLKSDIDQFEKTYLNELKDVISKKSKSKKINEVNYIVFNTEMFLKKIKAPQCPNCKKCPAKEKCKYKLWKKINNILVQKYSDYIKNKK